MLYSDRTVWTSFAAVFLMIFLANVAQTQLSAQVRRPCGPNSIPAPFRILIPQRAGGADLRPACQAHDACYAGGSGFSREECDAAFLGDMLCLCQSARNPRSCQRRACRYYRLTRKYGESAFRR